MHSDAVKRGGGRRRAAGDTPMQLLAAPQTLQRVDLKGSFPAYWPRVC